MEELELIFIVFGVVLFVVGFVGWYLDRAFFKRAIKVTGTVIDYEESENDEGNSMYRAIVRFEFNGETRTITSAIRTSWQPKIGAPRQVGVDPTNPQIVRIYSRIPLIWLIFIVVGMALVLGAIFS